MFSLALKSLLLSILLHLIVFNTFVFTFPIIPASNKPAFVFLGSILQKQDISELYLNKDNPKIVTTPEGTFRYHKDPDKNNPFFPFFIKKPYLESNSFNDDKVTLKSTFALPELKDKGSHPSKTGDSTLHVDIEPYVPLRLNDK